MEGKASISPDVLARYAADAAGEVEGVRGLVPDRLRRHDGVRVRDGDDGATIELHVKLAWGAPIPDIGRELQRRVADYLARMTGARPAAVDVVVREIVEV